MHWQRYILAFLITAAIFATAFYIARRLDSVRISEIRATEESISIDILSSETQYELLGSLDCQSISNPDAPILSDQLNSLASQLSAAENNVGTDNPDVIRLKQQYSLLEIKDFLLMRQITSKCGLKPVSILYFYSNEGDCPRCGDAGDVLTYLRSQYPTLRVYSFDYHLDLAAVRTLESLYHIDPSGDRTLPAFVIQNRPAVYGFKDLKQMQDLIPELKTLEATSTAKAATSTR